MQIHVTWLPPLDLWQCDDLIYDCDWGQVPDSAGVNVFARSFGDAIEPLYIGKAMNLQNRIRKQLNNVMLMKGVENAKIGPRLVIPAEVTTYFNYNVARALELVERALIEHYLSEDHGLLNIQGTCLHADRIDFAGNAQGRQTCPRHIMIPQWKHHAPK